MLDDEMLDQIRAEAAALRRIVETTLSDGVEGHDASFSATANFLDELVDEVERLRAAIAEHHDQKADDRCIEDDDRLYAAAGLPPCDRRVGNKEAMLANCARFIERRCEAGGWPTYVELESALGESLKLQSHYATLLNGYDGGRRLTFATAEEWLKRLAECREAQSSPRS